MTLGYIILMFSRSVLRLYKPPGRPQLRVQVPLGYQPPTSFPEGPYTLFMELGPKKTIPVLVLGT